MPILIAVLSVVFFRLRKRSVKLLVVVMLGYLNCTNPHVLLGYDFEGRFPEIRQCGQLVAVATCAYFNKPYQLEVSRAELQADDRGINLLKIKKVLEAHDLKVTAIRCKDFRSLRSIAHKSELLVVPLVLQNGDGHFVLVVKKHDGLVVVDVLIDVVPFVNAREMFEAEQTTIGGVVLAVGCLPKPILQSLRVPVEHDLGQIVVDNQTAPTLDFSIKLSNACKMARGFTVHSSCGCLMPRKVAGLIGSGEEQSIPVTISLPSWGVGEATRQLLFRDAMGQNVQVVRVKATGERRSSIQHGFDVSSRELLFSFGGASESREIREATVRLKGEAAALAHLTCTSDDDWVHVEKNIGLIRDVFSSVSFRILETEALLEKLKCEERCVKSIVKLATNEDYSPIEVSVFVVRSPTIQVEPRIAIFTPETKEILLKFSSDRIVGDTSLEAVECTTDMLSVSTSESNVRVYRGQCVNLAGFLFRNPRAIELAEPISAPALSIVL